MKDQRPKPDLSARLSRYGAARQVQFSAAYTKMIRVLRIALPILALVIVGVLIERLSGGDYQTAPQPESLPAAAGQVEMLQPKYTGLDAENRPYAITAKKAARSPKNPDILLLDDPMADITLDGGTWLAVQARQGRYHQITSFLTLTQDVRMFHDLGYEIKTSVMDIDIKQGTARSDAPVFGQGPAGEITARGLKVSDYGDNITFTGPAVLVLLKTIRGPVNGG